VQWAYHGMADERLAAPVVWKAGTVQHTTVPILCTCHTTVTVNICTIRRVWRAIGAVLYDRLSFDPPQESMTWSKWPNDKQRLVDMGDANAGQVW
jgi:hypothetical protein